ncbi:glycolate oxidase FAD binding subunit [Inhella inkyongensis]|uniref:Glycolate oxidase FAD binding subunit n=1 Tax=Inhella inkyongensis TaxID=392593 RepID=A0A840S1E2_9BURK|nr:glycolate oxidase subunit GlcE [Inhella inkyongensis]MBB5202896.1 glycolate oxidase FAD binding subunit [Inhella inkyongensis]
MDSLRSRVRDAAAQGQALELVGHGSKRFYGEAPQGQPWVLSREPALCGLRAHEPAELYVTAGAGTPLRELEAQLGSQGQQLGCEPPRFGGEGTVGGLIATALAGPARPYWGGVRDALLGLTLIDGRGELLKFGGTVMKNVAGFDVARAMCGAMGTLGLITEASFKLMPIPQAQVTLRFDATQDDAIYAANQAALQGLPLSASAWWNGSLLLRLSGLEASVRAAAKRLGGDALPVDLALGFWNGLRHQSDEFFAGAVRAIQAGSGVAIWRLSLPPTTPVLKVPGEQLIEWGGALRWLVTPLAAQAVRELAERAGGHATLYAALDKSAPAFTPAQGAEAQIRARLKSEFDPKGIFNPGRLG